MTKVKTPWCEAKILLEEFVESMSRIEVKTATTNFRLPYDVKIQTSFGQQPANNDHEKFMWCQSTFGAAWDIDNPAGTWCRNHCTYSFKREQDRTLFMLKWS